MMMICGQRKKERKKRKKNPIDWSIILNEWLIYMDIFFGNGNLDWGLVQCMNGSSSHTYICGTLLFIKRFELTILAWPIDWWWLIPQMKSQQMSRLNIWPKKKKDVDDYRKLIFSKKKSIFSIKLSLKISFLFFTWR